MKVCAEFEDQVGALNAHRHLIDSGLDPHDIEVRSPYPLAEAPIPPHYSTPMNMRSVVRFMWACAVIFGFSFVSYTQYVWAPVTVTDGHPLIPPPITLIVTYECGMFTAIWTTTFMFFLETFRYRSLVPPLEEDMPVAIGYVVLVIRGLSSDKALRLLEGRGARSVVTYGLMMLFTLFGLTGCARNNMREQDVYKSTEVSANYPPPNSLRMPSVDEASVPAPPPFDKLTKGDVNNFTKYQAYKATVLALNYDNGLNKNADKAANKIAIDDAKKNADFFEAQLKAKRLFPALYEVKDKNAVPPEMANWSSPVKADPASLHRGEILFNTNCSGCHGVDGLGDGGVGAVEYARPAPIGNGKNNMVVKDDENRGGQNVTLQNYTSYKDNYFYYYISTGKNLMPPFGYRLSPREICDIINHLHKLQGRPAQ